MTNIYECPPLSIDTYAGNGNSGGGSSTTIVRNSSKMVVLLDVTSTNNACNLPSDAEIGDVIEVYISSGPGTAWLYSPSGETFVPNGSTVLNIGDSGIFRKIASDKWARLKGA